MKQTIVVSVILAFLCLGCEQCDISAQYTYQQPESVKDGIEVGSLDEVGLDVRMLSKAVDRIQSGKHKEVHSMLIYKDEKLVLEEYFQGHQFQWDAPNYHSNLIQWDRDSIHDQMSCTKSFMSACIGIAVDHGFIENVTQSIFDYLPDHQHLKVDNREYITIEHLVTMTSGLAFDEWSVAHGSAANDIDKLYLDCDDPITCVLEKPWWAVPGEFFTYNGGGMVILGEILKNASGLNMEEFAQKYVFGPLNIDHVQWKQFANGMYDTAGSLKITPRAMLKFGITYLNKGVWKGERIVSSDWVAKSSKSYSNNLDINIPGEDSGKNGYGYTWWNSEFSSSAGKIKMFRAGGWGGQEIMVFPDLEMVVVFTGGNYATKTTLFKIIENYILPSLTN